MEGDGMRLPKETALEDIVYGGHRRVHLVTAIPTLGMVPIEFVVAFGRLQFPVNGVNESMIVKNMEIGDARNYVVSEILKRPEDKRPQYIFFLGDDMLPPWDGLVKLEEEMATGKWDVLTGLYYWKGEPPMPLVLRNSHVGRLLPGRDYEVGDVVWVDVSGLDFTLIKVSTLAKMKYPWFKTGPTQLHDGRVVKHTEDVWFGAELKKVGGTWGVHTGVRVAHIDVKSGMVY
jgi:hypothetical protein